MKSLEDALDELYEGQTNVAIQAAELNMSKTDLQQVFREYVLKRPIDDDIWAKDVEISWPYITREVIHGFLSLSRWSTGSH